MANESIKLKQVSSNKYAHSDDGEVSPLSNDELYDPHLHRQTENPTTDSETLIHLLKGCLGTGILAMPEAFKNAGILNGFISTLLIGFICTYCLHVLIKSQYILCKRLRVPMLTYPESMKIALESGPKWLRCIAPASPLIVDFFLVAYQLGICCVYIVFVGTNLKAVCDEYIKPELDLKLYMLMTLLPFILINLIRNLKWLAPFSTLANLLTLASFGIVCYYVFQELPDIGTRPLAAGAYTYPLFFGTTLFALEAVGVVIALENNMKTPKHFVGTWGVLNIGMIVVVILYVGMGFIGYWKYGERSKGSITLNFPSEDDAAKAVRILYSIAIFISYGLQGYVPVEILWKTYILKHLSGTSDSRKLLYEYILRVAAVLVTFVLAVTIPALGLFISLFGAFCLSALGLAFPALIEICVKYPNELGPFNWIVIKGILLIIFGVVGLLAGSYSVISEVIFKIQNGTLAE